MHGLILAGGQGSRMGGVDKALLMLGPRTLLEHVRDRVGPGLTRLAISANGDPARFARFGLPVLADAVAGQGPLGGMLAGLEWAAREGAGRLLVVPCDTPFLPTGLGAELAAMLAAGGEAACYASHGGRAHPTVALLDVGLRARLGAYLRETERRSVLGFMEAVGAVAVGFGGVAPDPFCNLNTREAWERAGARITR